MPMTIQDEYKYARRFGYDEAHRVWRQHRAERPTVGVTDHGYSECPLTRDELIAAMTPTLGAYPAAPWHELVRTARDEYARWWHSLVRRALNPSPPRAVVAVDLEDDNAEDGSDDSDGSADRARLMVARARAVMRAWAARPSSQYGPPSPWTRRGARAASRVMRSIAVANVEYSKRGNA